MASVVCCRPTACCRGHAGRCYGAAGVRTLPRLLVGQAWACGLACCADWQGWNLPAAPDSMAQRADGQRPSAQLLEPLGPVRDAPLTALRMRVCPCCVLPSSLPRARGADTMPARRYSRPTTPRGPIWGCFKKSVCSRYKWSYQSRMPCRGSVDCSGRGGSVCGTCAACVTGGPKWRYMAL